MEILIKQENKEVADMVVQLMRMNKTNLTKVCDKHNLNYSRIYTMLNREHLPVDELQNLIKKIDAKASFTVTYSVNLRKGAKVLCMEHKSINNK